jgi:hypothetical protein
MISNDKQGEIHNYNIYPLVIISDRYSGAYSGGEYTVWNCYPENIPSEIFSDDNTCSHFWCCEVDERSIFYGVGSTIQEAIDDLYFRMPDVMIEVKERVWLSKSHIENLKEDIIDMTFDEWNVSVKEAKDALDKYYKAKEKHENERRKSNDSDYT